MKTMMTRLGVYSEYYSASYDVVNRLFTQHSSLAAQRSAYPLDDHVPRRVRKVTARDHSHGETRERVSS